MAIRYNVWKVTFKTIEGNLFTGHEEQTNVPIVTNLRQDPWEKYQDQAPLYTKWWGDKLWTVVPASVIVGEFLETFKEYPPSQEGGTFGVDEALKAMQNAAKGAGN